MSVRYWLHGVQINIVPDNEYVVDIDLNRINLDEYEPQINQGRRLLKRAKASQPDAEIVSLSEPEAGIRVMSRFGKDEIQIRSRVKEKVEGDKEKIEELEGRNYVLLVEMGSGPGAVAVFAPNKDGYGAGAGGNENLAFVGWTNALDDESKDPKGLVGQTTYRQKWVNEDYSDIVDFPHVNLEQIYRVDQGVYAYAGDPETEEVTQNFFNQNIWCFENIPLQIHWESQTPGPPEESFCGYTWAPWPAYGGGEADFHDRIHLFYGVELATIPPKLIEWHPPEFNQWLVIKQYFNSEGGCCRYKDNSAPGWDAAPGIGVPAAVGDICFTNCTTGVAVTDDASERIWGLRWGTPTFAVIDYCYSDFPYTSYRLKPFRTVDSLYDPPIWFLDGYGVYLAGEWKTIFIQGASVYDAASDWVRTEGAVYTKRDEVNIEENFHPDTIPEMTARQLLILQGNEDAYDWKYDPYTNQYHTREGRTVTGLAWVSAICGGEIFKIVQERHTGSYEVNGWTYQDKWVGYFWDYGIFTKVGTGIDNQGDVEAKSVDPIYAYCLEMYDEGGDAAAKRVIYGMVIDSKHYRTKEYEKISTQEVNIPEAAEAVDKNQSPVTARLKVRVGVRKPYIINKIA